MLVLVDNDIDNVFIVGGRTAAAAPVGIFRGSHGNNSNHNNNHNNNSNTDNNNNDDNDNTTTNTNNDNSTYNTNDNSNTNNDDGDNNNDDTMPAARPSASPVDRPISGHVKTWLE